MITKPLSRRAALAALAYSSIGLVACSRRKSAPAASGVAYYTCAMHPFVRSQDPDSHCPVCGMQLVPVMRKDPSIATATSAGPTLFTVPVQRQQQIGVTYAPAERTPLRRTIQAAGIVEPDKTRQWNLVARVEGYVQKLDVTSPGEQITQGQPLFTIYSPDLLTAERELVNLLNATGQGAASGNDQLIEAARDRLKQWNVTPRQIADLEQTRKPSQYLTVCSPFAGTVQQAPLEQGRKVLVGDSLMRIADLSAVWVWAQFYEEDGPMLARGLEVSLTTPGYPGEVFKGQVSLVDPFLDESTRATRVRIDIPNADLRLRPGMFANVQLTLNAGVGLTIPVSAVMPTGERALVFIDKGGGSLEPRYIDLGGTFNDRYQVIAGLREGERVVASANFLIDAESQVQGAVKSFQENDGAESGSVQ